MDAQVVIEWERPSTDGLPTNNYLASLVETYISGRFVSVLDQGEKWAAHRGKGLLPYDDLDRCCSSSCEQHPL